jgi:hypothetical protein
MYTVRTQRGSQRGSKDSIRMTTELYLPSSFGSLLSALYLQGSTSQSGGPAYTLRLRGADSVLCPSGVTPMEDQRQRLAAVA